MRADRPRYPLAPERGHAIAQSFFAASRDGNMEGLRALLAADVTVYADGGGLDTLRLAFSQLDPPTLEEGLDRLAAFLRAAQADVV